MCEDGSRINEQRGMDKSPDENHRPSHHKIKIV